MANFEIARRKQNARNEELSALRNKWTAAVLGNAPAEERNAAKKAVNNLKMKHMIERAKEAEERRRAFVEGAPNLLRKLDEQAAEFEAKKKYWAEQNAKRTQEQFNRLRSLPKNEALRQINQMINITRRAHANHIAATRSTAANTRKYLNRAYNSNFDSTLAAYDPALNPSSPEAKAMNKVITNRLKTIKNTRKISRQNLNTDSKLREASLKKIGKNINTNIKMLEKLKKEISKKST